MSIDPDSPSWRAVKAAIMVEIECDSRNLEMQMSMETTQLIRGRIAAYRTVLALADTPPPIVASTALY